MNIWAVIKNGTDVVEAYGDEKTVKARCKALAKNKQDARFEVKKCRATSLSFNK